jgi:hypothetical protein
MRLRGLTFLAAGALVFGGGVAAMSAQASPGATAAGQKTWAKFTGAHVYKPQTFFFGAHEEIDNMHWSTWGKTLARGTGTYQVNSCIPDCADGTITPTPATVILTGRELCGNRYVFRRMKVYFSGRKRSAPAFCS